MFEGVEQPVCTGCAFGERSYPCRKQGKLDADLLAKTWLDYARLFRGSRPERENADTLFWASECLHTLTEQAPESAFDVIMRAFEMAGDDETVAFLAAGPMEDLIGRNGELVIRRIEEEAWRDSEFRKLLQGVWSQGDDESDVWQRVLRAREGKRPSWMPTKGKRDAKSGSN